MRSVFSSSLLKTLLIVPVTRCGLFKYGLPQVPLVSLRSAVAEPDAAAAAAAALPDTVEDDRRHA